MPALLPTNPDFYWSCNETSDPRLESVQSGPSINGNDASITTIAAIGSGLRINAISNGGKTGTSTTFLPSGTDQVSLYMAFTSPENGRALQIDGVLTLDYDDPSDTFTATWLPSGQSVAVAAPGVTSGRALISVDIPNNLMTLAVTPFISAPDRDAAIAGSLVSTGEVNTALTSDADQFRVGSSDDIGTDLYNGGVVDEVSIWRRALSIEEYYQLVALFFTPITTLDDAKYKNGAAYLTSTFPGLKVRHIPRSTNFEIRDLRTSAQAVTSWKPGPAIVTWDQIRTSLGSSVPLSPDRKLIL